MRENVTIIGAGLGGLVLAGALYRHGIKAVVYEARRRQTRALKAGSSTSTSIAGSGRRTIWGFTKDF